MLGAVPGTWRGVLDQAKGLCLRSSQPWERFFNNLPDTQDVTCQQFW